MAEDCVYIIKENDGDWSVCTLNKDFDEFLDGDELPDWYNNAKVMRVTFKPQFKLVGPVPSPKVKLEKL